jgi:outer membrane protein TolC
LDAVFDGRGYSIRRMVVEMIPEGRYSEQRMFGTGVFMLDAVFSVPLYTGGRIQANVRRAELEQAIAADFVARTQDNVIYEVARTYLTILQQDQVIRATEQSVKALTESLRVMEQFRAVGKIPSLDLYRVRTQLADVQAGLVRDQALRRTLRAELRALLGWTGGDGPRLTDELKYQPQALSLDDSLHEAFKTNPAYAAAGKRVAKQEQAVRLERAELKPQVTMDGFGGAASSEHGAPIERWGAGVKASQFLFDGGRIRARVRAEEERLGQEREMLRQTGLDLTATVETAHNDAEDASARVEALEAAIKEAQEALRLEQLKYANGKGLVNDVLLAQAKLLQVQVGYYTALRDYGVAQAALRRAIGRTASRRTAQ